MDNSRAPSIEFKSRFNNEHESKLLDLIHEYGKSIYQTTPSMQKLVNVMEHPEFRNFIDTYFNDADDAKSMLMFMKVYQEIEKEQPTLTPYQKLGIHRIIIDNAPTRKKIHKMLDNWINLKSHEFNSIDNDNDTTYNDTANDKNSKNKIIKK